MKVRKVFALSILATSIALAAGCSSDDDDDTPPVTDPDPTDPDPTDPDPTDPDPTDPDPTDPDPTEPETDMSTNTGTSILDIARGTDGDDEDDEIDEGTANAELTSFVSAAAGFPGILNLLDDETATLTVFAPNNAAFGALGADAPTGDALERVLSYHVIDGTNLDPTTVSGLTPDQGQTFSTAAGADVTVTLNAAGTVVLTDGQGNDVEVVQTVEGASNGTVHVIGSVLLPPDEDPGTDPDPGPGGAQGSTLAALQSDPELSSVAAIVGTRAQSLEATDAANRAQIVFAPKNDAIDPGATSILAYTVTSRGEASAGQPAAPGTYTSFADLTGDPAGTKLEFVVAGEGETLTVNGVPAELVETTSGPVLYVFGGTEDAG